MNRGIIEMNLSEYLKAIANIPTGGPVEYVKRKNIIGECRYEYLKSMYLTVSEFRKAYTEGLICRYEVPGGNLFRELLKNERGLCNQKSWSGVEHLEELAIK